MRASLDYSHFIFSSNKAMCALTTLTYPTTTTTSPYFLPRYLVHTSGLGSLLSALQHFLLLLHVAAQRGLIVYYIPLLRVMRGSHLLLLSDSATYFPKSDAGIHMHLLGHCFTCIATCDAPKELNITSANYCRIFCSLRRENFSF